MKISISALPKLLLLSALLPSLAGADAARTELGGHTKLRLLAQSFPSDSVFSDLVGSSAIDTQGDLRLNLQTRKSSFTFVADYQLAVFNSELLRLPDDDRRLLDLTATINESGDTAIVHRLDRFWLGYTSEKTVVRFGRQALSWGNGLFYAPMDLVNPFNPAAVDTEYKAGDDMLYMQYLQESGADIQGAYVIRRDFISGDVDGNAATAAVKYHGFKGPAEFDLLVAKHYGDTVIGVGVGRGIGGAQWGADLVVTDTDLDTYFQLVTNLSYSWVAAGRNMSGILEYHYNGFGQKDAAYDPVSLATNPDLLSRQLRGESFAVGQHYIAGSVLVEVTPLWTVSPTLLSNIEDPSALLQLVSTYSVSDNATLLGSLNLPLGPNGSEFGGIETGIPDRFLSQDAGLFLQFAWYF